MKWLAYQSKSVCSKQPLAKLLADQLDAHASAKVTEHLDHCEECQQRLTKLSAEPNWWREAGQWLENATLDEDLAEEYLCEEFGEHQGPSPEESLIQSGLLRPTNKLEILGSIGRYDVRRVIGTGGTGIVLQAVDTELDRVVAVKVLAPSFAGNGPARRRFSREGQAAAAVVHENVVSIHHVESNGPVPFLVMQYVDGCSLQEHIIRLGPLDSTATLRIIAQLASALDAAHAQGLVHRDVKPANILVGTAGQRVWITDFGLARAVDDASLTRTGFIAGTPHYMSPEQARGETIGPGSDLFGLGSVMYFTLTGRPPFRAERSLAILNRICSEKHRPVREVNPDVPSTVAAIVDRLLEKDSRLRYQTANEVRDECLKLLSHPESHNESQKIPIRKKPRRVLVNVLICLFAISLTGIELCVWNWQSIKSHANSFETLDNRSVAFDQARNQMRNRMNEPSREEQEEFPLVGNVASRPSQKPFAANSSLGNTTNDVLQKATTHIPSEQELWQTAFDTLESDLQNLRASWKPNNSQADTESSVNVEQVTFDQHVLQLQELFWQLELPVSETPGYAPPTTY